MLFKVRIFQFYSLFSQVEFEPGVTENNRLALKVFVEVGYKKETSENIYPVFLPAAFGIGRDPFFFGYNFRTDKTGFIDFSANQIFTAITVGRGAE